MRTTILSAIRFLIAAYDILLNGLVYIGLSLIIFMMLVVSISVFLRHTQYAFGWQLEAAEYILIVATFLGTGWLLKTGGHIRVDIIPNLLSGRKQKVYNGVIYLIVSAVCLTLVIVGSQTAWEAYVSGTLQIKVYTFPKWILISVIPFGTFFLFVESLKLAYRYLLREVILVVDDEADVIDTIEELLKEYRLDTARTYEEAQGKLSRQVYDVVVLDIMGVQGLDLLKLSMKRDYPAILLTAHAVYPKALKESMESGAVSFVPKEYMRDIALYVNDALTKSRKEARLNFYRRLGDYFDKRFGANWDNQEEFWTEARKVLRSRT